MKINENKTIVNVIKEINNKFGKDVLVFPNQTKETIKKIEMIDSGSLLLNKIIGYGGYPKGRLVEIYGPESAGKTTMTLMAIRQLTDKPAVFLDIERAFD
jgi:recombination protein RecA